MISLEEAKKIMDRCEHGKSNESFAVTFLKCNRDKKTGGEFITIINAQKHGLKQTPGYRYMVGIFDLSTNTHNPAHERLLFKINGQEVFW